MFICIVIFTQSTDQIGEFSGQHTNTRLHAYSPLGQTRRKLRAQSAAGLFHTQESGEPLNLSPLLEGLRVVE